MRVSMNNFSPNYISTNSNLNNSSHTPLENIEVLRSQYISNNLSIHLHIHIIAIALHKTQLKIIKIK